MTTLKNRYNKTMIYTLMLASFMASPLYGADDNQLAQQEENGLLEKASVFYSQNPIVVMLGTTALATGIYALAAKKCGLPSLQDAIKERAISLIDNGTNNKESIFTSLKMVGYTWLLTIGINLPTILFEDKSEVEQNVKACEEIYSDHHWTNIVLTTPIQEEAIFTYIPHLFLGKYAQFISPILFALAHEQYDFKGKLIMFLMNLNHHKALLQNPKHPFVPLLAHMFNNALSYSLTKLRIHK